MEDLLKLVNEHWSELRYVLTLPVLSLLYSLLNRPWFGKKPKILEIPFDHKIPLLPWTVFIYNLWYPILLAYFIYLSIADKNHFFSSLAVYTLGSIACFLVFLFYQNEVPRYPEKLGSDPASRLLAFTWRVDNPYNGFPSIHCFACIITILSAISSPLSLPWLLILLLSQVAIMLSTLTTKQHVLVDLIGGIVFAILSTFLVTLLF